MKTVGVRELKNRLSEYLRRVRAGEGVLVTDRGQIIAELGPPGHGSPDSSLPAGLLALAKRELLTPGAPPDPNVYVALRRSPRRKQSASRLLDAERGPR